MLSAAGTGSLLVENLPYNASGIMLTGKSASIGTENWVEIQYSGKTGWVNSYYLTEYVNPSTFCADAQVTTLLQSFKTALNNQDGKLLMSLVSPVHGLYVQYVRDATVVHYTPVQSEWLFVTTYVIDWGTSPASGLPVKGNFHEVVVPKLLDVYNNY